MHIDDAYAKGWQYSALVFLGINLSAVISMLLLYTKMFMILNEDRKSSIPDHVDKHREDMVLAVRFFFIVFTDCLCWLPIVLIKILAFIHPDIVSPTVYAWVVVFILPINSAINPLIYTIAAPTAIRCQIKNALKKLACPVMTRCCRAKKNNLAKRNSSTTSTTTEVVILSPNVAANLLKMNGMQHILNENEIKRSSSGSVMSVVTMNTFRNNVSTCSSRRDSSSTVTTTLGRGSFNTSLPLDSALTTTGRVIIESPADEKEETDKVSPPSGRQKNGKCNQMNREKRVVVVSVVDPLNDSVRESKRWDHKSESSV